LADLVRSLAPWLFGALVLIAPLSCGDDQAPNTEPVAEAGADDEPSDDSSDDSDIDGSVDDDSDDIAEDETTDDSDGIDDSAAGDDGTTLVDDGGGELPDSGVEQPDAGTSGDAHDPADAEDASVGPTSDDETSDDASGDDELNGDEPGLEDSGMGEVGEPDAQTMGVLDASVDAGLEAAASVDAGPAPGSAFPEFDGGTTRQFIEVENNDALAVANGIGYGSATIIGEMYPNSDYDFFRLELRHPTNLKISVEDTSEDPEISGCNERQILMELLDGGGTEVERASSAENCPKIDWQVDDGARAVPPGIYYVRLRMFFSSPPAVDEYRLTITYDSQCGDGVVEGEESCEGEDGCAECQRTASCGDGFVDVPDEGCEDTGPDDGCTEQCLREFSPELEPNDVIDDAIERAAQDGLVITDDVLLGGSLVGSDRFDVFQLDAAEDSLVYVTAYNTEAGSDCVDMDAYAGVEIYHPDGEFIRGSYRALEHCGAFAANLAAGQSYFLQTLDWFGDGTIDLYRVEVDFVDLVGSEQEGTNDTPAGAMLLEPTAPMGGVAVTGFVSETDKDWYSVIVPPRHALRADALPSDAELGSWCSSYDYDLRVQIYNEDGISLGGNLIADDDSYCGKVEVNNALATPQRLDVLVETSNAWVGGEFGYNLVLKTRSVAP
jgi:hypothetical protein